MHHIPTTATAFEKLKLAAKAYRDAQGCQLSHALEAVACQSGYANWKHVTECAEATVRGAAPLLPARHRLSIACVVPKEENRHEYVHSVEELCEKLGGIRPYFIRRRCEQAGSGYHCLCELDPFATAMQANIALDLGDKHDSWHLLFDLNKPAREFPGWQKRAYVGLATEDTYPNEHLTNRSNQDRSNALNPNNPTHQASLNNRSMHLNPENWRFGAGSKREG
ncbi:hypothetical protein [Ramlibacter sp. AN1133]|uniref:hypothetical protein n=1 Tax=Ramlibacter sp. AN1133 TaxID=3133429 RepID=UPI0030C509A4